MTCTLEIAANSLASALAAQAGGADRIELCENLEEGGCTPSYGTIAMVRERLRIPVFVLVRPRGGDFLYDTAEIDVMRRDVEVCARLGCDGVVLGALDAQGDVDTEACRSLLEAAAGLDVTFHRAFDAARDPSRALESLVALGFRRVLTSGAAPSAIEGAGRIAELQAQARDRVALMAGAGVTAANAKDLVRRTGVREVHASARGPWRSPMRHRNEALPGLSPDAMRTDESNVRALVDALRSIGPEQRDQ